MEQALAFFKSSLIINLAGYTGAIAFLLLSAVHFYWMAGGKRGLHVVVPSVDNRVIFTPPATAIFVIAFGFLVGAFVFFGRMGLFYPLEPKPVYQWLPWVFTALFVARIVGDLQFVGLFKKVKNTTFSYLDNMLYIPISLVLALCSSVIALAPM